MSQYCLEHIWNLNTIANFDLHSRVSFCDILDAPDNFWHNGVRAGPAAAAGEEGEVLKAACLQNDQSWQRPFRIISWDLEDREIQWEEQGPEKVARKRRRRGLVDCAGST